MAALANFIDRRVTTIKDVVDWGLCCGCGACVVACDRGAVSLVNIETLGIRPVVSTACNDCMQCLAMCPGYFVEAPTLSADSPSAATSDDIGVALELWEGYACDPEIRYRASSGGVLSALALYCIEREGMGSVVHVASDPRAPWLNRTVHSHTRDELIRRSGSRYAPASPCDALGEIERGARPVVFIGKPCDASAVALMRRRRERLNEHLGIVLAFFCAGAPSSKATLDLIASLGITREAVREVRYRGEGWPGMFTVRHGETPLQESRTYRESWSTLAKYRPLRCHLCPDGLGRVADISCGDAWQRDPNGDDPGRSIIIARTERGCALLRRALAAGYIALEPINAHTIRRAQEQLLARRTQLFGRLLAMRFLMLPTPLFTGFSLLSAWRTLSFLRQARIVVGTLRRLLRQRRWRRSPDLKTLQSRRNTCTFRRTSDGETNVPA
jgi:coenzyme F420 hydrogenase subunit beta